MKQVQDVTIMILQMMTRAPLMLVGGIILAVSRDAVLSLIFLAALPLLGGFIYLVSRKAIPSLASFRKNGPAELDYERVAFRHSGHSCV